MAKFGKKKLTGMKAINTASLPDIVFMLLFFFMVTTVMRETEVQVQVTLPFASQVKKMEKRYFAFRKLRDGKELAVFTGRQPRQAALKAASRGNTDIFLRERGTKKVHQFKGTRRKVAAPYNRPDWMSATVWKPNVRKVGLIKPAVVKKAVRRKAVRKRTAKRRR